MGRQTENACLHTNLPKIEDLDGFNCIDNHFERYFAFNAHAGNFGIYRCTFRQRRVILGLAWRNFKYTHLRDITGKSAASGFNCITGLTRKFCELQFYKITCSNTHV